MYQKKLDDAVSLLREHNVDQQGIDKFLAYLGDIGGTSDSTIIYVTYEDLQNCGLKPLVARAIANIFRSKCEPEPKETGTISNRRASAIPINELIGNLDVTDSSSKIYTRVKSLVGSKKFLVYDNFGNLDIAASSKLFDEVRNTGMERSILIDGSEIRKVYSLGEAPDKYLDENPCYPGSALFPDGTCQHTHRNIGKLSLDLKQFLYLLVKDLNANYETIHNLLDIAETSNALDTLKSRYPMIWMKLEELKKLQNLPVLKIKVAMSDKLPAKSVNLFDGGHTIQPYNGMPYSGGYGSGYCPPGPLGDRGPQGPCGPSGSVGLAGPRGSSSESGSRVGPISDYIINNTRKWRGVKPTSYSVDQFKVWMSYNQSQNG